MRGTNGRFSVKIFRRCAEDALGSYQFARDKRTIGQLSDPDIHIDVLFHKVDCLVRHGEVHLDIGVEFKEARQGRRDVLFAHKNAAVHTQHTRE